MIEVAFPGLGSLVIVLLCPSINPDFGLLTTLEEGDGEVFVPG